MRKWLNLPLMVSLAFKCCLLEARRRRAIRRFDGPLLARASWGLKRTQERMAQLWQ